MRSLFYIENWKSSSGWLQVWEEQLKNILHIDLHLFIRFSSTFSGDGVTSDDEPPGRWGEEEGVASPLQRGAAPPLPRQEPLPPALPRAGPSHRHGLLQGAGLSAFKAAWVLFYFLGLCASSALDQIDTGSTMVLSRGETDNAWWQQWWGAANATFKIQTQGGSH